LTISLLRISIGGEELRRYLNYRKNSQSRIPKQERQKLDIEREIQISEKCHNGTGLVNIYNGLGSNKKL